MEPRAFNLIAHPLSDEFLKYFHPYQFKLFTPKIEDIAKFWVDELREYHSVISTTSSKLIDKTNSILIEVAKKMKIPTLGFLDHWKGFDRFFNENNDPIYLPNWLGVIDQLTYERLASNNIIPNRIASIGHPWLDHLYINLANLNNDGTSKKILIVSQPEPKNKFYSIFCDEVNHNRVTKYITKMRSKEYNAFYRPHPKESKAGFTNLPIDTSNYMDVLNNYDIFIGYDSMMLLEAHVMEKQTLYLDEFSIENSSDQKIPFKYGIPLNDAQASALCEIPPRSNQFQDSIIRGRKLINDFLESVK